MRAPAVPRALPASLQFADDSSNKLDFGSGPAIDAVSTAGTIIFWVKFTSVANLIRAIVSITGGTDSVILFRRGADGTSARFTVVRSGPDATVDTVTGGLVAGQWLCICLRWRLDSVHSVYRGTMTRTLEAISSSPTLGTGTHDHTAGTLTFGQYASAATNSDAMNLGAVEIFDRDITDEEAIDWQEDVANRPSALTALQCFPGEKGAGSRQIDWSRFGNHGTITGCTLGAPMPHRVRPDQAPAKTSVVTYTATCAAAAGGAAAASTATSTPPTFSAEIASTSGGAAAAATATATPPTFSASCAAAVGGAAAAASCTSTPPTFSAEAAAVIGGTASSVEASFGVPTFTASCATVVGGAAGAATATSASPTFTASCAAAAGGAAAAATDISLAAPPPVRLGQLGGVRMGQVGGLRVGAVGGIRARPR